ncbi:type I glyceraldehyde-3-phosphate dehydrogenase, partial [Helicobacter pylori]
FKGIVSVDEERLVSSDFISSPFSAIVIDDQIMTIGEKNAKVLAWYDNEMGYSERLIDMVQYIAQN